MSDLLSQKPPSYYVRKRLFSNKPAVFGLWIIVLSHIVAALGYLIMPDGTPNANDGAVQIQKKTPLFTVDLLKIRKSMDVERTNWLLRTQKGQQSSYTIIPISTFEVVNDSVLFTPYGRQDITLSHSIVHCSRAVFVGNSEKLGDKATGNYIIEGDTVVYLDIDENINKISLHDLTKEFMDKGVERRTFYLGTDKAGRDILSRLLFGTRISLAIGFVAVLISLVVGVTFGALGGFFGGKIDILVTWMMTVVWSIPSIMLVIAISLALQSKGVWVTFVAVGLTTWVDIARVVRGQIFSAKQKLYVEAARAFGLSNRRIIFYHILPNIVGPIIVISTANFATAILTEAGLSFLGLGVQPPTPSWGVMINEGFHLMGTKDSWHLVLLPGLCISVLVLAFNLFGNGLRDAYDPQGNK